MGGLQLVRIRQLNSSKAKYSVFGCGDGLQGIGDQTCPYSALDTGWAVSMILATLCMCLEIANSVGTRGALILQINVVLDNDDTWMYITYMHTDVLSAIMCVAVVLVQQVNCLLAGYRCDGSYMYVWHSFTVCLRQFIYTRIIS